jgi:hypothetical protein
MIPKDHLEESAIAAWDDATQWLASYMFTSETMEVIEDREQRLVVSAKKVLKTEPDEEYVEVRVKLEKTLFVGRFGKFVMRKKLWELLGQIRGVEGMSLR